MTFAGTPVLFALEVDHAVALLVTAAAEARGDAAVVVTAGLLGLVLEQLFSGSSLVISPKSCVDMPRRPGEVGLYLMMAMA